MVTEPLAEPVFDEASLNDEERKAMAMLRQAIHETLAPLFEARWPDFEAMIVPLIEKSLMEASKEQDDQLPKLLAMLVTDAVKPVYERLNRLEAALFRRAFRG